MNVRTRIRATLVAALVAAAASHAAPSEALRQLFANPPDQAKPRGYWVWPHGNFDYSTIRRELAEFQAKGLGGVDIFDLGIEDRKDVIPPGPGFMSPEQVDGIAFALEEAKRLGLKMGLIVSSSWNAGGSWTPPELAMMNLVAWREEVTGPARLERALPFPDLPESFRKPYGVFPLYVPKDDLGLPLYRRDVAVLAYPLDPEGRIADPMQVRLLNDRVDASGKLTCDLPAGRWVVMRTLLVNFGQRLWLPSDRSQGLTMDHFSRAATRHHFETIIGRLEARLGPLQQTALERLYLASYEANAGVIWTPGFEEAFRQQNGYRIEPFLPALYGTVVVDRETTDRFLYDYRKTVSELFIENLYREASRTCRKHGLRLCSEAGGPGTPLHDVPTEELKALGAVDVMRGEFWNGKRQQLTPDGFEELQVVKPIASAAHIYGRRIAEMEAFTSHINWQEGPDIFKRLADRAFCEGMTRAVYHTMSHNLPEAGRPGWTYQAGSHMSTNLTWWDLSYGLHRYLARASALLQHGDFVADVACYYGDEVPNFAKPKHVRPGLGYGYDYDDLNTEVLLQATVNPRGEIVLPSGMRYAVLTLPEMEKRMGLAVLQKLEHLLESGATVVGGKPERTYGLRGFPTEQERLRVLADRLWGESPGVGPEQRKVGKGLLVFGRTPREVLAQKGIGPDLTVSPASAQAQIDFIHRRAETADVYFVRNAAESDADIEARFRVQDRRPELWDAVTGTTAVPAAYQQTPDGIVVPIHLPAHGSVFVVFCAHEGRDAHVTQVRHRGRTVFPGRDGDSPRFEALRTSESTLRFRAAAPSGYELTFDDGATRAVTVQPDAPPLEIAGSWEVRFPAGWDLPTRQLFDSLQSWTDATDAATRAFSGVAAYAKRIDLAADRLPEGQRVLLDLGEVREVARVYLNGQSAGLSSFAPHLLDVTGLVRPGENALVIEVANTWLNRLIADDALPEAQHKTRTNLAGPVGGQRWRDAQPKPSGLLGPVRLLFPNETVIDLRSPARTRGATRLDGASRPGERAGQSRPAIASS
jgi:hypothetical protein